MLRHVREDVTRMLAYAEFRLPDASEMPALPDLPDFLKLDGGPGLPSDERGYAFGDPVLSAPGIFAMGDPLSTDEVEAATSVAELFGPDFVPADPETWQRTVSRNTLCPCGSGRKFKHCHGLAE